MDLRTQPGSQSLQSDEVIARACRILESVSGSGEGLATARDVQSVIDTAVAEVMENIPGLNCVQRYALRYRIGPSKHLRSKKVLAALSQKPEYPTFVDEFRICLRAVLAIDPEAIRQSYDACYGRVRAQELTERGRSEMEESPPNILEQKSPNIYSTIVFILSLISRRSSIGSSLRGGDPGLLVYKPDPLDEDWRSPQQLPF